MRRSADTSNAWSGSTAVREDRVAGEASPQNGFSVAIRRDDGGWVVVIVAPDGVEPSRRVCRDEAEARTFASTVRQHIAWLSEERFREYYQLGEVS